MNRRAVTACAALAALTMIALWGIVQPGNERLPGIDAGNLYSWEVFTTRVLGSGALPHWNPLSFAGVPHLADTQTTVLYPPHLMLRLVFPPARMLAWSAALHIWMAGMGMLLLCRVLGTGWGPALLGAVGYMFGGAMAPELHNGHLLVINALAWFPFAIAFAVLTVRENRALPHPGLPIVLMLQFLAGYLQGTLYITAVVAAYFLYSALWPAAAPQKVRRVQPLRQLVVVGCLTAGLCAFQLLPTATLIQEAGRGQGLPYELAAAESWSFAHLSTLVLPFAFVPPDEDPMRVLSHQSAFVGVTLLAFMPLAIADRARRRHVLFFLSVAVAAVLLAVGDRLPFYQWHYRLFPGLRIPARVLFVAVLGLAVAGAVGVDTLLVRVRTWSGRSWLPPFITALAGALLLAELRVFAAGMVHTIPVEPGADLQQRSGVAAGGRLLSTCDHILNGGGLLAASRATLDGVGGVYLSGYADFAFLTRTGDRPPELQTLYQTIGTDSLPARLDLMNLANVSEVVSCTPLAESGLTLSRQQGGLLIYENAKVFPRAFWTCSWLSMPHDAALQELAVARYEEGARLVHYNPVNIRWAETIVDDRRAQLEVRYGLMRPVFRGERTWRYELRDTSSRNVFALIQDSAIEDTHGIDRQTGRVVQVRGELDGGEGTPGAEEVLVGASDCRGFVPADLLVADQPDGRVVARVTAPAEGMLFLSEPYYPERRAWVDGEPAEIRRATLAFSAVPLTAGTHEVELRYVPSSFRLGMLISLVSVACWLGLSFRHRNKEE